MKPSSQPTAETPTMPSMTTERPILLADVAPSILRIMGLEQPVEMTGKCLMVH